jgi:hypothetical protein
MVPGFTAAAAMDSRRSPRDRSGAGRSPAAGLSHGYVVASLRAVRLDESAVTPDGGDAPSQTCHCPCCMTFHGHLVCC